MTGPDGHDELINNPHPASAGHDIRLERTLQDLADFIGMAREVTSRTRAAYDADVTLRLAGQAIVIRVGEAVGRLPESYKDNHPGIPWRSIKGARNLTSHDYYRIDPQVIWQALSRDLPEFGRLLGLAIPLPDADRGGSSSDSGSGSPRST